MLRGFRSRHVVGGVSLLGVIVFGATLYAQEGHPLVGSWHGDRGTNAKVRTDITLVMDYDGTKLTGVVNPGFEAMELQNATLIPKGWLVHFELAVTDASGKPVRCVIDGKIDKLGSDQRILTGTWVCGSVKQDFTLTRDRDYYR